MYQIFYKGECLHDLRNKEYTLREPAAHLTYGEAGTLSFVIDAEHPRASIIEKMKGIVELKEDGATVWTGRILRDTKDFDNARAVECEGIMAVLNDSVIPPHNFPADWLNDAAYQAAASSGNVVQFYLNWLIGQHNEQVAADHQISLGTVDVTDPSNYIERSTDAFRPTLEVIRGNLTNSYLGGFLCVRYSGAAPVLDYKSGYYTEAGDQNVVFGQNLLDIESEEDGSEVYSSVVPVGKDGLTIASFPDGTIVPGITKSGAKAVSEALQARYGDICKVFEYSDDDDVNSLVSRAVSTLQNAGTVASIRCGACDLHYADSTIPSFRIGHTVQLKDEPHGLTTTLPITDIEINIVDPAGTQVTLGKNAVTFGNITRLSDIDIAKGIAAARAAANGKARTFAQDNPPNAADEGDIWIDTDDGNKLYRWTSGSWREFRDTGIATAQETADGIKENIYFEDTTEIDGGKIRAGTVTANELTVLDNSSRTVFKANATNKTVQIGGWTAEASRLHSSGIAYNYDVGMSTSQTADGDAFYVTQGAYSGGNYQFRVQNNGTMTAEKAVIHGAVNADSLNANNGVYVSGGDANIEGDVIANNAKIQHIVSNDTYAPTASGGTVYVTTLTAAYVSSANRRATLTVSAYFDTAAKVTNWGKSTGATMEFYIVSSNGPGLYYYNRVQIVIPKNIATAWANPTTRTFTKTFYLDFYAPTYEGLNKEEAAPGTTSITFSGTDALGATYSTSDTIEAVLADCAIVPNAASSYDLGTSVRRWNNVYCVNVNQSSARIYKKDIADLDERHEILFDNLKPRRFKLIDGESGREHYGLIVDEVRDAIDAAGLDTDECAAYVLANKSEPDGGGSLRYTEFIALLIDELQKQKKKIAALETIVFGRSI